MKRINIVALISLSILSASALGVAVSYAAYNAPDEQNSISFGSMTSGNRNFQSLAYYFAGGSGTSVDPFLINYSHQLRNFSKLWNTKAMPVNSYVSLASSFQYEGDDMEPIGTSSYPFTGEFNGCGFAITGLKVTTTTETNVGLFGTVGTNTDTGVVQNLVLVGPHVKYQGNKSINIGIVAGYKNTTTGYVSTVQNIEIYGGTSNFNIVRARVTTGSGAVNSGNAIVGSGGSSRAGFVSSLVVNNETGLPNYSSTYGLALSTSSKTYSLWLDGTTVRDS